MSLSQASEENYIRVIFYQSIVDWSFDLVIKIINSNLTPESLVRGAWLILGPVSFRRLLGTDCLMGSDSGVARQDIFRKWFSGRAAGRQLEKPSPWRNQPSTFMRNRSEEGEALKMRRVAGDDWTSRLSDMKLDASILPTALLFLLVASAAAFYDQPGK